MLNKKITIFAPDFKPMLGGVAEYTYQLANELNNLQRLDRVLTTVHQEQKYDFKTEGLDKYKHDRKLGNKIGDNFLFIRKTRSLIFHLKNYIFVFICAYKIINKRSHSFLLITSIREKSSKVIVNICHLFNIKYGVVLHGKDIIVLSKNDNNYLRNVCKQANVIIFNSWATKKLFYYLSLELNNKFYILYPGINPRYYEESCSLSITELEKRFHIELQNKTIILSVARLDKRKGIDIAIRAVAPLLQEVENVLYIIAGQGNEYEQCKHIIESYKVTDKIILLGKVTEEEKFSLMKLSSIFLMPNHTLNNKDFEGFGISFIEASYLNNAIIAGKSGGAIEAVKENVSGFLIDVEAHDSIEIIRLITKELLDKPDLCNKISINASQYVVENFLIKNLVSNFVDYLDREILDTN